MSVRNKKKLQLGMDAGTAANRLKADLLFDFAVKAGHKCHRCGEELDRETFSVEHIEAWLDSDNPVEKFFSIENIAYSHMSCNYKARRVTHKKYFTEEERHKATLEIKKGVHKRNYDPEKRRDRYKRNGT